MKGRLPFLFKRPPTPSFFCSSFRKHSCHCESPLPPCNLTPLHSIPSPTSISLQKDALRAPSEQGLEDRFPFPTWRRFEEPLPSLHRDAPRAREPPLLRYLAIPHLRPRRPRGFHLPKVERAIGPSLLASQCRYESRRPPTIPGTTTSRLESLEQRLSAKRARTSGPGESFRASEHPTDSKLPTDLSPESIIRPPMVTAPPIEGNSNCRAKPFHSELYFD